jgi:hypothetical protein
MRICNPKLVGLTFGAGLAIAASTISASATTLTDGDFSGTITVSSHPADANTTISASTPTPCASCGNGGAGLQATANNTGTGTTATISDLGFIDHSLSYNPAIDGAIASISASYDRLLTRNFSSTIPLNFRLVIEQDGIDYVTAQTIPGSDPGIWHNLSLSDLLASNFSSVNFATGVGGSAHPNFAGDQILFGVEALASLSGGQTIAVTFDNIDITVSQTPLPAALPLFASGLGALGLLGWRRKRKASAAIAA